MPQSFTLADAVNVTPSHPSRLGAHGVSKIAVSVATSVLMFFFAGVTTANGQTPFSPIPAQSAAQSTVSGDSSATTTTTAGSEKYSDANSPTNASNLTSFSLSS